MEHAQEPERGSDQHDRVENEDVYFHPEIPFFFAKENVQLAAAPVIALLHLGVRDQVGDLLVHIKLLGCDWTGRVFEKLAIEWTLSIQDPVDYPKIAIELVGSLRFLADLKSLAIRQHLHLDRAIAGSNHEQREERARLYDDGNGEREYQSREEQEWRRCRSDNRTGGSVSRDRRAEQDGPEMECYDRPDRVPRPHVVVLFLSRRHAASIEK